MVGSPRSAAKGPAYTGGCFRSAGIGSGTSAETSLWNRGFTITSSIRTLLGLDTAKRIASATSSGWRILASWSGPGGIRRVLRTGVSVSPGMMLQARIRCS